MDLILAISTIIGGLAALFYFKDEISKTIGWIKSKKDDEHIPIPSIFAKQFTSKMATTIDELEKVLEIRRSFFGSNVIVPDDAYQACWLHNPYCLKVIYDFQDNPIAYWGLVPISCSIYNDFLSGKLSHDDILTKYVLDWKSIDPKGVYLYIIGAVVPPLSSDNTQKRLLVANKVLLDMFQFAVFLFEHINIKGICGYPSKTGGFKILKKLGFKKTGIYTLNVQVFGFQENS